MSFPFQVAALFHIGTTKSHPPIPEHLSAEAKDFLLKCLEKYNYEFYFSIIFFHIYGLNILKSVDRTADIKFLQMSSIYIFLYSYTP